jgi:hypothetical protein
MASQSECTGGLYKPGVSFWSCLWSGIVGYDPTPIGVAPAPPESVWTVPPVSGVDATQTVNALVDQQLINQQAINASGVYSSGLDTFLGGASNYINTPSMIGVLVIVGVFAFMVGGNDAPRRYGR